MNTIFMNSPTSVAAQRQELAQLVKKVDEEILTLAGKLYSGDLQSDEEKVTLIDEILTNVNELLTKKEWQESLFLTNAIKPVIDLKSKLIGIKKTLTSSCIKKNLERKRPYYGTTLIYISVYQANGYNISAWEKQLSSIENHASSRPIYLKEHDVLTKIMKSAKRSSEAYVIASVTSESVSSRKDDNTDEEKENNMVIIKQNKLTAENIIEFIHIGIKYAYINGKLLPITS